MKLALICLVSLVGLTVQESYYGYGWPYGPFRYPGYYDPYYYAALPESPADQSQGRWNTPVGSSEGRSGQEVSNDGRFGGNFIFTLGGILPSATSTTTRTVLTTVTSTATTATVLTCIPSTYFSKSTACRRRRAIFEDSGLEPHHLQPSEKLEVEPSVAVQTQREEPQPVILSSQEEVDDQIGQHPIQKRYVTTVTTTTVTSTSTSYSFSVTTYTKTLFIGSTTSVLLCLPSGFTTC